MSNNKTYQIKKHGSKVEQLLNKIDVLSKDDIGLDQVNNTSDADKPVSTLQRQALINVLETANSYTDSKIVEAKTIVKDMCDGLQYKDAIVIGNAEKGATPDTCDILYSDGDDFRNTFDMAREKCVKHGIKTIKVLTGEYRCLFPIEINDELELIGQGMPYIYVENDVSTIWDATLFVSSSNVMIEGIKIGEYGGASIEISNKNIKLNNIITESAIRISGDDVQFALTNSTVKEIHDFDGLSAVRENCIVVNNNIISHSMFLNLTTNNIIANNIIEDIPQTGGGTSITIDNTMSDTSENAVQNKVIKKYIDEKQPYFVSIEFVDEEGNIDIKNPSSTFEEINEIYKSGREIALKIVNKNIPEAADFTGVVEWANIDYEYIWDLTIYPHICVSCNYENGWEVQATRDGAVTGNIILSGDLDNFKNLEVMSDLNYGWLLFAYKNNIPIITNLKFKDVDGEIIGYEQLSALGYVFESYLDKPCFTFDFNQLALSNIIKEYFHIVCKPGDDWEIEVLPTHPQYDLIMKVIVGYSVLTSKPADWESNYTSYYKNTGTLKEPVYTALTEPEEWKSGEYYNYTEPTGQYPIDIETEPDGTGFSFSKLYIRWEDSVAYGSNGLGTFTVGTTESFSTSVDKINPFGNGMHITGLANASTNKHIVVCEINNGLLEMRNYYGNGGKPSDYNVLTPLKPNEVITAIKIRGTSQFHLMGNTEIYIYGVRA